MKRIRLIVNPLAGGKDKGKILQAIQEVMEGRDVEVETVFTEYAGHAVQLAKEAEADIVVAVGGDGTQNEVARGLLGTGKVMGIMPCGSGDGIALHLGVSRNPRKAALNLMEGVPQTIDYGVVNGRPFFCTTGVGLDAIVSWKFAQAGTRGLKTYVLESAKTWFGFKPECYTVTVDGKVQFDGPATLITVGNAGQWGNNAWIAPLASVCDGQLDVTIVKPFHTWSFPSLLVRMVNKTAHKSRHALTLKGRHITIRREHEGPLHFDGDPRTEGREIEITMVPSALRVLVPQSMKGKI